MKIKSLIIACMLSLLLFSGCNKSNVIIAGDMIKYNAISIEDFGFNIKLITPSQNTNVEFVSFVGDNIQGLTVKFMDETHDDIKNLKHNGYYIRLLGFICNTVNKSVRIDGVNLKVDGQDRQVMFQTPLKHTVKDEQKDAAITLGASFPIIVATNSFKINTYGFQYSVNKDTTLEKFEFSDFLVMNNAKISINDVEKGELKDLLPLEVKKGSIIEIRGNLEFKNIEDFSDYYGVYCSSMLTYTPQDGVTETFSYDIACQNVSNPEDAKAVIDIMRNKG